MKTRTYLLAFVLLLANSPMSTANRGGREAKQQRESHMTTKERNRRIREGCPGCRTRGAIAAEAENAARVAAFTSGIPSYEQNKVAKALNDAYGNGLIGKRFFLVMNSTNKSLRDKPPYSLIVRFVRALANTGQLSEASETAGNMSISSLPHIKLPDLFEHLADVIDREDHSLDTWLHSATAQLERALQDKEKPQGHPVKFCIPEPPLAVPRIPGTEGRPPLTCSDH